MTPGREARPASSTSTPLAGYDRRSSARDARPPEPRPFDPVAVPLDPGIALVEASAGTGKTYSITQLVLRLLLEDGEDGTPRVRGIGNVLVVTFTNAATDELITRVRAALRDAVDVFAGVAARTDANEGLFALRERYGDAGLPRLEAALRSLDQLSIFTIHGFCKRVLEESALESGTPLDAGFLEDDALLLDRVAQDWWRRTVYENSLLATLAVYDGWSYRDHLDELKAWRRYPDTRIEPRETVAQTLVGLRRAVEAFATAWDAGRAAEFLGAQSWRTNAPLVNPTMRARMVEAGSALARGDLAGGMFFVQHGTTAAIRHEKTGIKLSPKASYDAVPTEPCVAACDAIAAALARVRGALRVSCIEDVSRRFDEEKEQRHLLGFDDLLRRLKGALTEEQSDGPLARAIRKRYDAALIDEFQDTDPYQFPIFSTAFAGRPLFLIGDPKQAIYGFRGADVFAYMEAARRADAAWTLGQNWRSTPHLVGAVNALFARQPDAFLYPDIAFRPVTAARNVAGPLEGDGKGALHWLFVPPTTAAAKKKGAPAVAAAVKKGEAERRLHAAMAGEIVRLVRGKERGGMGLRPGQIAVLVRSAFEGQAVLRALRAVRVPCIVAGLGDIMKSREMLELEQLLRAVLSPQQAPAVRAALATELWGMDAPAIHRLSRPEHEHDWQALAERLAGAREAWTRHGFMRMIQDLLASLGAAERLLAREDGERRLTDLRHAVELLHNVALEERLSPEGLLLWIGRARARDDKEDVERRELRLESDAEAVQIVTVHKSKGLEYDVVFCPGLWTARRAGDTDPVLVHVEDDQGRAVVLDHGSPERAARGRLAAAETLAEELRLAYVALTRARFRCYVGWGAIVNGSTGVGAWESALGWLLRGEGAAGTSPEDAAEAVARAEAEAIGEWGARLDALVAASGGTMTREELLEAVAVERWEGEAPTEREPRAREPLPPASQLRSWRIASFTSLTAGHQVEDARDLADAPAEPRPQRAERRDDFMDFPAGRHAGIALHALFEHADFAADRDGLRALASAILRRHRLAAGDADARVDATVAMMQRVLGAPLPAAAFALRDVPRAATLREWTFDLPLGPVDRQVLSGCFERNGGEVARRYLTALRAIRPEQARGFLTGVIDLAFVHGGRWYVVDWKSNHLGADPAGYERDALEAEMIGSHYVLQYHLYVTALHRFLRARQPGYDYDAHMGGVHYAFLRGIDGSGRGWFHDRPPRALVEALSALMDAGMADREATA